MLIRLSMVLVVALLCMALVVYVESAEDYIWRNFVPILTVIVLSVVTLRKGHGSWTRSGWRWPLATLGFAIPALGLSIYLHYGYLVDRNGMVSTALNPQLLFEYLPIYTVFAGCIGFAIGWIVGRNV